MPRAAAITHRGGKCEEQQVAARDKSVRPPCCINRRRWLAGQRRIADLPQHAQIDDVVTGKLAVPLRALAPQTLHHTLPAIELDTMALAVIETDSFNRSKARERPS